MKYLLYIILSVIALPVFSQQDSVQIIQQDGKNYYVINEDQALKAAELIVKEKNFAKKEESYQRQLKLAEAELKTCSKNKKTLKNQIDGEEIVQIEQDSTIKDQSETIEKQANKIVLLNKVVPFAFGLGNAVGAYMYYQARRLLGLP